ncbi:hypothetical protein ACFPU1_07110 [Thalassorhabdus alkalitolerans]|uniref:Uncharacterized protein n=1 Tax=Thalassorhabdus alkalitolerans TaxID=2282697 RepID=A0ABW0YQA2_9BACI
MNNITKEPWKTYWYGTKPIPSPHSDDKNNGNIPQPEDINKLWSSCIEKIAKHI